jgi:hypothetical protein
MSRPDRPSILLQHKHLFSPVDFDRRAIMLYSTVQYSTTIEAEVANKIMPRHYAALARVSPSLPLHYPALTFWVPRSLSDERRHPDATSLDHGLE